MIIIIIIAWIIKNPNWWEAEELNKK